MATNDDTNCADDQPLLDAGEQIGLTLRRISEDLAQSRRELNEIRILLNNQHDASRPETAQSPPQTFPTGTGHRSTYIFARSAISLPRGRRQHVPNRNGGLITTRVGACSLALRWQSPHSPSAVLD